MTTHNPFVPLAASSQTRPGARRTKRVLPLVAAVALAAAGTAQTQAAFTSIGTGCSGAAGVATLTGVGAPYLGERFYYDLDNVPANSLALRVFGTSNPSVPLPGMPGCTLYASLDAIEVAIADGNGHARFHIDMPEDLSFAGQHFYLQGAAFDATANSVGIVVSNGGDMQLGIRPTPNVLSMTPTSVGPDGVVQITGTNFPSDPGSICLRAFDAGNGSLAFLRADSVVQNGAVQVLTAHVELVAPTFGSGTLMVAVGNNRNVAVGARTHITEPGQQWAWNGIDAPGAVAAGNLAIVQPDSITSSLHWSVVGGQAQVRIPRYDPCDSDPNNTNPWRPRTLITSDLHFDVHCPNGATTHYDHFLQAVTVAIAADGDVIGAEHMDQITEALAVPYYGPPAPIEFGQTLDTTTTPQTVILWARPQGGSGCTITGAGGSLLINCPDEQQCMALTGLLFTSSAELLTPSPSSLAPSTALPAQSVFATDLACSIDGAVGVLNDAVTGTFTFFDIASHTILNTTAADANFLGARIDVSRRGLTVRGTAIACKGSRIRTFDMMSYQPLQNLNLSGANFKGVVASLHGRYIAAWGDDKIYVFERPIGSQNLQLRHTETVGGSVTRVVFNPNSAALSALNNDNLVRDYSVSATGTLTLIHTSPDIKALLGLTGTEVPSDMAFTPNGTRAYVVYAAPLFGLSTCLQEIVYDNSGAYVSASGSGTILGLTSLPVEAEHIATTDNGKWMMVATSHSVVAYDLTSASTLGGATSVEWIATDAIKNLVARKG